MNTISYRGKTSQQRLERIVLASITGLVLFVISLFIFFIGFQVLYLGRIYPGTSIAGVNVGGLTTSKAAAKIAQEIEYPQTGQILLTGQDQNWLITPAELGLILDPETSAQKAFNIGRSGRLLSRLGEQFNTWYYHRDLSPIFIFDQQMTYNYLNSLAQQINIPVREPTISIEETNVVIRPGQVGHTLDVPATLDLLGAQMRSLQDGLVPLIIETINPKIHNTEEQADLAKAILAEPLTISMPEDQPNQSGPWRFNPTELASMLVFEAVEQNGESYYEIGVDRQMIQDFLLQIEPNLFVYPDNPRFIFNDETLQLDLMEPAVIGRELDIEKSAISIKEQVLAKKHDVTLEFTYTPPSVDDNATGQDLGITELVHAETSYFFGSSGARIQNIAAAAGQFHGLLVAPGETFSMADALGDISLDNGYAEALIIYGDQTIKGVGGGVCQVSTTLFRTAFFAGFPVVERHAHAYRVSYYEKDAGNRIDPNLAGLDATVYVPVVDFKFKNDTPNWLLMETYVNPTYRTIIWKFYSTSDGRSVEWDTTGPTNIVEAPEPLYKENEELEEGEIEQIDWESEGADITVDRTVFRNGEILLEDTFFTHYEPWRAIYEYGPGTEGMPPEPEEDNENNEDD